MTEQSESQKKAEVDIAAARHELATFWQNQIKIGSYIAPSAIGPQLARFMIENNYATMYQLRKRQISW